MSEKSTTDIDENPPIAETQEERLKNALDYHLGYRQWSKKEAALKSGISRAMLIRFIQTIALSICSYFTYIALVL